MLEKFIELVNKLKSTTGRLEKEAFLREYKDNADVKAVLYFLFNPYIVTGISGKKLKKKSKSTQAPARCLSLVLEYFVKNNTGRDVDVEYLHAFAGQYSKDIQDIIYGVIAKDLKLGIQEKTLNKVFGAEFIPTLNVMLAESFFENEKYLDGKEFVVTQKLDGVRAVLIFQNDTGVFYSRGGRVIEDLIDLQSEANKLDKNYVYDGELLIQNPKPEMDAAEIYRATVKITASDDIKRGITFNIFDKVLKDDFIAGISQTGALVRKRDMVAELEKINSELLVPVSILFVGNDISQIPALLDKHTQNGEEGIMVNPSDSPYECKRTKNLLKVKKFHTADVLVLSIEEGGGANKGKLGAVHVQFMGPDKKLYTCKVGSGFRQDDREMYFANPDAIIGKIIEIGYFELSKNQNDDNYSLRFPTFKHIRHDKTQISMH
ncbi:MAG: hypothetical protein FWE16_00935 [Firmicutes bacterium]|nr:hypothetical protein [Bacillota bacterium]